MKQLSCSAPPAFVVSDAPPPHNQLNPMKYSPCTGQTWEKPLQDDLPQSLADHVIFTICVWKEGKSKLGPALMNHRGIPYMAEHGSPLDRARFGKIAVGIIRE